MSSCSLQNFERIWIDSVQKDIHVRFRRTFELETLPGEQEIQISADTEFAVYVNGNRLKLSQFPDYPDRKTFRTANAAEFLRKGRNSICVLVHYYGENFSTHRVCAPGLMLAMPGLLVTDGSWKASPSEAFAAGKCLKVTGQLGFRFDFDADREDSWIEPDYDDSAWPAAVVQTNPAPDGSWKELVPSPVPSLVEAEPESVTLAGAGYYLRDPEGNFFLQNVPTTLFGEESLNLRPVLNPAGEQSLRLPGKAGTDGVWFLIDAGLEMTGYLILDVTAKAGTVIEIHHGEHLDDGRVRSSIGPRRFIDSYRCREGRNRFTYPLRRLGARYLQLFSDGAETTLHYAGIRRVSAPLPRTRSWFLSDDRMQMGIRDLAIRTMECCMHDHYEDCPWREQSLYTYDSRNQMLFGYYVWGNYDFAAASLDLLGKGFDPETEYLELCAPASIPVTIPIFSFVWIAELREHFLFSGSADCAKRNLETADAILDAALRRKSRMEGLYEPGTGKKVWNFYEWTGNLGSSKSSPDSLYNLYLAEALTAAAELHERFGNAPRAAGFRTAAENLLRTVERVFWDEKEGGYQFLLPEENRDQKICEHVQLLMFLLDAVPFEKRERVLERVMFGKELVPVTFSVMSYFVRAMFRMNGDARCFAEQRLRSEFERVALAGASTLWETANGGDDFDRAGSLCHAWSGIPAYYAHACNLGIRPLEPGFRMFEIKPYPGSLPRAAGSVPTPEGEITVDWRLDRDGLSVNVKAPAGLEARLADYPEFPVKECLFNGKPLLRRCACGK